MWKRRHDFLVVPVLLCVLAPVSVFAQATAGISGTVKDETGAILPGITVTAMQGETGLARTVVSDDKGLYRILNLNPGTYELRAELSGFRTTVRSDITLRVGDARTIDLTMAIGQVSEMVVVTGEAPLIEQTSAVMGGVIEQAVIENIPLNGRGYAELALLQPNVVWSSNSARTVNQGYGQRISVSGMRPISNSYTLDGQDVADFFNNIGGVSGAAAGIEAVREFKVVTNPYSAEYGKTGAGEIQVVTRSGGNQLQGSVYEFHRNSSLDEKNYFDTAGKPDFRRNQFGGAVGGPIVRNKTFFYGNYEGLRESLGQTRLFNVPDENVHQGYLPDRTTGQLRFVGIAPNVSALLALYPLPTRSYGDGRGEYPLVASRVTDSNYWMARIDHSFTASTKLYGRYSQDTGISRNPADFFFDTVETSQARYLMVGLDSVLSSNLFNSFIVGFNRSGSARFSDPRQLLTNAALFFYTDFVGTQGPVPGAVAVGDISTVGGQSIIIDVTQNVYQVKNDTSLTAGRHTMRFGGNFQLFRPDMFNSFNGGGSFTFFDLEGFMQGQPASFISMLPGGEPYSKHRQSLLGLYYQDDIRLTPTVVLNAGVRYETVTPPRELNNRISNERDFFRAGIRPEDAVIGHPYYLNASKLNFAPRLGLAWSPNEKTSVRLGFGTFFDHILGHHWRQPATQTYPFFLRGQVARSSTVAVDFPDAFYTQGAILAGQLGVETFQFDVDQPTTAQYTLNVQRELGTNRVISVSYVGSRGWNLLRVQDYNQREPEVLADGTLFFPRGAPIRSPAMERVRGRTTDAKSFYNAFSVAFQQRYSKGLAYQASYTFSESTDDASNVIGSTDYTDGVQDWRYPFLPPEDARGPSNFDVRHNFVLSVSYELPFGAGRAKPLTGVSNAVFGGWNVSALWKLSSGLPFSVLGSRSSSGRVVRTYGALDSRPPNLVEGRDANSISPQNPNQYFDPTAFALPEPGFLGNLGRNALVGPGMATLDLSFAKDIAISAIRDDFRVQLRAEFFNIFNRANFSNPSTALFDSRTFAYRPDAGRITSTRTTARQLQFAVKIMF